MQAKGSHSRHQHRSGWSALSRHGGEMCSDDRDLVRRPICPPLLRCVIPCILRGISTVPKLEPGRAAFLVPLERSGIAASSSRSASDGLKVGKFL
jgi:hypothetical protein